MEERLALAARASFAPERARRSLEYLSESSPRARSELQRFDEAFLDHLAELVLVSPPMLDSLARHPEWIGWLNDNLREEPVQGGKTRAWYNDAWREWGARAEGALDVLESLGAFKRREYLRIAYLDIAGLNSLEETVQRLSNLADFLIDHALSCCWENLACERPAGLSESKAPEGFSVFAMGKLGGRELNYSSDVDLLFLRRDSERDDELRFYTRLGERLVHALSHAGPEGSLYRVDMRLRPYGESGPLVPSMASVQNYYESWGESWERQALIKARVAAGDADLGRRFAEFVANFAFARQMDDSALEDIKRVKYRSEKEYALPAGRIDLKQGAGGIRDIEFYVQYLQLIGGGRAEVRARATLEAIRSLAEARLLLEGEESQLSLAYRFFRIVEHRLQLKAFAPQAVIPHDCEELAHLARGLGFGGQGDGPVHSFMQALGLHRSRVRSVLERIYLTPGYLYMKERDEELAQLLSERTPRRRVRELLAQYGFQDIDMAWQNIRLMALGPAGRMLPPGQRRSFLEFAFPLLEVLRDSLDPDQALHHLESFASASGNRLSFLRALASRRPHLQRLANLLAHSNLCHQILSRHPEYFDSLASGINIIEGRSREGLYEEVELRLRHAPGEESRWNQLRRFRQREMIRIAYRDLANLAGPLEISLELSDLAEASVLAALDVSGRAAEIKENIYVVALGKFGSRQLHYSSDLDLIFLYDAPGLEAGGDLRAEVQLAQDARIEELLDALAGITSEGAAYHVDLRLRPEGASGLLARSWEGFMEYARDFMQPWERMALVRSRMLNPQPAASCRWNALVSDVVYGFPWDEESFQSIRRLKRRIEAEKSRESSAYLDFKYGRGGIADLEFLVQFLQLRFGRKYPAVRTPAISDAIPALESLGALSNDESSALLAAHRVQRHVENHYQLMEEWASREISRESPQLARLARSLGFLRGSPSEVRKSFLSMWEERARVVRALVEKYFYGN